LGRFETSRNVVETSHPACFPRSHDWSLEAFMIGCSGSSAAMPACDGASRRAPAERTAKRELERMRALGRAPRRGTGSRRACARPNAQLPGRSTHGGMRSPFALERLVGGGPSPLTEDRQKPRCRQYRALTNLAQPRSDGRHETRNTVPSIAFVGAKRALRCGSRGIPSRSG
jgi:hypothetical protein